MTEVERLSEQLTLGFQGESWHGPPVMELLAEVSAKQAAAKPVQNGHGIWELVKHMILWEQIIYRRLRGEEARLSEEDDWLPITDTSESAWQETVAELASGHEALVDAVSHLKDEQLDEPVAGTPFTLDFFIYGVLQHNLYHAGQIALLKKAAT